MQSAIYMVVYATFDSRDEAHRVASLAVQKRLAACAQLENIESVYRWQGAIERSPEIRVAFKTRSDQFDDLKSLIQNEHSYDVPEIIALPIMDGLSDYLDWIDESTAKETEQ